MLRGWGVVLLGLLLSEPVLAESGWPPPLMESDTQSDSRGAASRGASDRQPKASTKRDQQPKSATAEPAAAESEPEPKVAEPPRPKLGPATGRWRWRISKAAWSVEDERDYEAFIRGIGESDCETVHKCLTSATANPRFHDKHPPAMQFFADCADLPYILRAYFAWQRELPFSFSVRYDGHPRTPNQKGKLSGNRIADRFDIVGPGPDPRLALPAVYQFVSSEHFRTPPAYKGEFLPDHYPIRITRESVLPGTVIFDPDGHLAVVYKVTEDGRIQYIDAHPDNSLTRGHFNREFSRAEPAMGAGFKRWRPQKLVGAKAARDGSLDGGKVVLTKDSDLADWSDEQFFGNKKPTPKAWEAAVFEIDGETLDYHDYVRLRLAFPGFKYNPIEEVRSSVRQLCRDLRYRADAVDLAIKAGIHKRPQPDKLPHNIYASKGDWETYSTPSRDARIKTGLEELRDETARFLELAKARSGILDYAGADLRADLLRVYTEETAACAITYIRTDGKPKELSFEEIKRRLFNLSFDPHHCIERRWGATEPDELSSCPDDRLKTAWYVAQDRLRNQLVRTYGEPMGWDLAALRDPSRDIGIADAPDIDTLAVLRADAPVAAARSTTGQKRAGTGRRTADKQ